MPSTPTFEDLLQNNAKLDSLNSKLSELAIRNELNTPICREIPQVLARNQQVWAENIIFKRRLREIERIVCKRKERKQGKRNVLKGKTVVSTLEVLKELEKCEVRANLKKTKRRSGGRRNQVKAVQEVESSSEEKGEDEEREVLEIIEEAGFKH